MKFIVSILLFAFSANTERQSQGDEILGYWWTEKDRAKVEIYKENGKYSGRIIELKKPNRDDGTPILDDKNPDESLRKRPVIGIHLIHGFTYDGSKWVDGEVYNPHSGKTYSCVMKLEGDELEVRGYIGLAIFGKTVVWHRTPHAG